MIAKSLIIILVLLTLAGGGAFALYQAAKPPGLSQIRANPALFRFEDYKDKAVLHTRLLALFPRGTQEEKITEFFGATRKSAADCIITHHQGRARFHLSAAEKRLIAIQVMDNSGQLWPDFTANCTAPRQPPSAKPNPLTPDAASAEHPIYLPLEPIPGVE